MDEDVLVVTHEEQLKDLIGPAQRSGHLEPLRHFKLLGAVGQYEIRRVEKPGVGKWGEQGLGDKGRVQIYQAVLDKSNVNLLGGGEIAEEQAFKHDHLLVQEGDVTLFVVMGEDHSVGEGHCNDWLLILVWAKTEKNAMIVFNRFGLCKIHQVPLRGKQDRASEPNYTGHYLLVFHRKLTDDSHAPVHDAHPVIRRNHPFHVARPLHRKDLLVVVKLQSVLGLS